MGGKHLKAPKASGGLRIKPPNEPQSTQNLHPVFCLRHLSKSHSLGHCTAEQSAAFVQKLHELCQLDWQTIDHSPHQSNGHEWLPRKQIKATLPARVTPDVDRLMVFRFGDVARILGIRDGRVFEVYIIDPKGKAYKH